jgi:hypothetical protein
MAAGTTRLELLDSRAVEPSSAAETAVGGTTSASTAAFVERAATDDLSSVAAGYRIAGSCC